MVSDRLQRSHLVLIVALDLGAAARQGVLVQASSQTLILFLQLVDAFVELDEGVLLVSTDVF